MFEGLGTPETDAGIAFRGGTYFCHGLLGGYRHYSPDTAKRVRFIKRAQALGFTLEEISGLLRLDASSACAETKELAAHKLALIEEKLAELAAVRKGLAALVSECGRGGKRPCPIIQMLVTDDVS